MSIQILPCPVQICCLHSIVPGLTSFVRCWEDSVAGGALLSVSMPALQKIVPCVACMSESLNVLVAIFFPTKTRLILKPENAISPQKVVKTTLLSITLVRQLYKVWISPRYV